MRPACCRQLDVVMPGACMPAARKQLSDSDSSVVPLHSGDGYSGRLLGDELRMHRERRGFTLKEAAHVIRGSISKVSRMERGESPIKYRDLSDLSLFYGISRDDFAHLEQMHQQTSNEDRYARFADVTPHYFKRLIRLEQSADWITVYEHSLVPGLLQTEPYARALARLMHPGRPEGEVERIGALRKLRQEILRSSSPPRFVALIHEKVLYAQYCSPCDMAEQVGHLIQVTHLKNVSVRILPMACIAPPTSIYHMKYEEGRQQELSYAEHRDGANYITSRTQLDLTRMLLTELRQHAYPQEENLRVLDKALAFWDDQTAAEQSE
ncbi:helix-turn-helix domain-containing protein [Streptomyces sp. NPDC055897]